MQESPEETNPLLHAHTLPPFGSIDASHMQPAIEQVLRENRQLLAALVGDAKNQTAPDWDSLMLPLDDAEDRLDKVWSTVSHLNGVMNTEEVRAAYNVCQPLITEYYSQLGQNQALYNCVQALHTRADELNLNESQRKIISDALLDFRLAGVSLPEAQKQEFMALETRLSKLSNEFSNNVLDATRAWTKLVEDRGLLAGLPESTVNAAAEAAQQKQQTGYLLSLDFPCYFAVMSNADSRALREEMYKAYNARASDQDESGGQWDNRAKIDEILSCRAQLASLLSFANYAELSVTRKMAGTANRVIDFLQDMITHSYPAAKTEFNELAVFAQEHHDIATLEAWDITYFSEKLRKQRFDISQEELRVYFPVEKVKQGLFSVAATLYGIEITPNRSAEIWHEAVEFYDIHRNGEHIASFFFDLFTREGKRGGAWMAECRNRREISDRERQLPVAYLVCNFAPPTQGVPALLSHNDVTTLFHEFGHGLHHMLTREPYLRSAGIRGVAWDAVELPSQLMENWCWEPAALALISGHYQSGEPLPDDLLAKMLAAKNFQAGMRSMRQLEFALFDFLLHQHAQSALPQQSAGEFVRDTLEKVRQRTTVFAVPDCNRFENSFSHIFAGGYAAGYYSYKWAEVLSADVFSRFVDNGVFNTNTGTEFLDKILSRGGGANALTLFTDFMGREPTPAALLRQEGLHQPGT